jgi:tetratricopeptide (TPR) repeat protein
MNPFADPSAAPPEPTTQSAPGRWRTAWRVVRRKWVAVPLLLVLVALAAGVWRYRATRPEYRLARGEEAVRARDWRSADALAERLEATGHADHAHLLRATALHARQQPDLALAECNLIRGLGSIRLRAATLSGKCLLDLGELAEADRAFTFVVGDQPDNADAHRGLAAVAYDLGQLGRAITHLEQVIRLDPGDARPHRLLGNIYRDTAVHERAEAEYREALRLGGGSDAAREEVRFELAENLIEQGKFADALDVLEHPAPQNEAPPLVAIRAEALRGSGRRQEAIAVLDRALAVHPDGVFYRIRGQMHLEDGDAKAAVPMLEKAARLYRRPYQVYFLLSQAYAVLGRKADADRASARATELRRLMERATELTKLAMTNPSDPGVRLQLAGVFDALEDPSLAAMWRRAASQLQAARKP